MSEWGFERYKAAYLEMAKRAKYRPGAPSDGLGHIVGMSEEEFGDLRILEREAAKYAAAFLCQEDEMKYPLGCPNGAVNKAFFYVTEAARLLCGGSDSNRVAPELLRMAIEEVEAATKARAAC
jgi:hypothetical protein